MRAGVLFLILVSCFVGEAKEKEEEEKEGGKKKQQQLETEENTRSLSLSPSLPPSS